MAQHNEVGKEGEALAAAYLVERGYIIRQRNWRFSRYEIDLVTEKNGLLHFIEVKCRSYTGVVLPEESVTKKKLRDLFQAIDMYLHLNPGFRDFRLHILSIIAPPGRQPEYFFIEDVYP